MSDSTSYDIKDTNGLAVLLVMENFTHSAKRTGADNDERDMKDIARRLGMQIFNTGRIRDLRSDEVKDVIKQAVAYIHENCTNIDRFMFMVSSHGREREHKGQKSHAFICIDDEELFVDQDVIEKFSDTKCPGLEGKPKLLFIQACRGRLHCS